MEINQMPVDHEHATVTLKVLLLIFAIVLVGALGYLVWTQNTAPDTTDNSTPAVKSTVSTADWTSHTNTKYGYTVKYPKDWKVSESTIGGSDFIEPHTAAPNPTDDPLYGSISAPSPLFYDKHDYTDWTYDRFFNYLSTGGSSEREEFEPIYLDSKQKVPLKVDGIDSYLLEYQVDISGEYGVFVKRGNSFFIIALTAREDHKQQMVTKYGPILRAMVATLHFSK